MFRRSLNTLRAPSVLCASTRSQELTKLNTLLVEAVQIPYEALEHDLVLKVSKQCTQGSRGKLLTDDNAGRTFTLEVLVQVLILFTAGKCNNLSCHVSRRASAGWCCSQCQHLRQAGCS